MNLTKTYKITCLSGLYFFQLRDLKLPDLEKLQRNGQFYHHLVPPVSVALIAEIRVIHYKKYNFYYPDIFRPNIYRYFSWP